MIATSRLALGLQRKLAEVCPADGVDNFVGGLCRAAVIHMLRTMALAGRGPDGNPCRACKGDES